MSDTPFTYSIQQLCELRQRNCVCINRDVKRKLKFFRIYVDHINVINNERRPTVPYKDVKSRPRTLVPVKLIPSTAERKRKCDAKWLISPSLVLSNLRSISNKIDELTLRMNTIKPDLAIFTESWLDCSVPDDAIFIDGYKIIRRDRNCRGGGIISYVSDQYVPEVFDFSSVSSIPTCDSEILSFIIRDMSLLVICVYHPYWNDTERADDCMNTIIGIIDYVTTNGRINPCKLRTVLCGDFNGLREYYDEITRQTNLETIVDSPTRNDNILDQIFTNIPCTAKPKTLPPIGASDHSIVLWKQKTNPRPTIQKKTIRCFSKKNKEKFNYLMHMFDWDALIKSESITDNCVALFQDCIRYLFDFCFPSRTVRTKSSDAPWITLQLKLMINARDTAFNLKQHSKYLRLRNQVRNEIRYLKGNYIKKTIDSGNIKKMWSSVKYIGRHASSVNLNIPSTSSSFTANDFSDYFVSTLQSSDTPLPSKLLVIEELDTFSILDVYHQISQLKRRGIGFDGIPFWVYRDFSHLLTCGITELFNRCISASLFPSHFKYAEIVPIPKISKPKLVSEYRPISLCSNLSKVFEKLIVRKLLLPHLHGKFNSAQFAYIPGPGTGAVNALTLLMHRVFEFLDSPGAVRILSIDLSKAFDKAPHNIIISAAERFGLPQQTTNVLISFLENRFMRVKWNNITSEWRRITSGVPQGSIMGPILFSMVVDSFQPVLDNTAVIKYADDISLIHCIRKYEDDRLQDEWNNCVTWSSRNRLPINISKSKILDIVTKRNFDVHPVISAEGYAIPSASELTLLGLSITPDLKWSTHVNKVITKACQRIYIVRNLRRGNCPPTVICQAYAAFIRSILLYAYPAFCNLTKQLKDKFVLLERRVSRIIGKDDVTFQPIMTVADRTCFRLFSKIESDELHPLRDMFLQRQCRRTRDKSTLRPPKTRTKRFGESFIKYCHEI